MLLKRLYVLNGFSDPLLLLLGVEPTVKGVGEAEPLKNGFVNISVFPFPSVKISVKPPLFNLFILKVAPLVPVNTVGLLLELVKLVDVPF